MKRRQLIVVPPLLALVPRAAGALVATPAQTPGPFYPDVLPLDDDNDLAQVAGQPRPALGTVLHLAGRVLAPDGAPVPGALVEIWQCDANGRYHHPRDAGGVAPDPGFQGYGRVATVADGGYRFRTIRPVAYPGRTPHIHFAVTAPGRRPLVTQMYVRDEPRNPGDFLYARIPVQQRGLVTVALAPAPTAPLELAGRFDIVLAH
jgi:protocatechuate 3,4-dioxygenase beta subunit